MTEFQIPVNAADADGLADELGQIAAALEWKRAALVYARVKVGDHGGDRSKINADLATDKLTPKEHALRGIHGLRSQTTIRAYWRAWDNLVSDGKAQPVSLGDTVELPDDAEWTDYYVNQITGVPTYYRPSEQGPPVEGERLEYRLDAEFGRVRERPIPPDLRDLGGGQCPPLASDMDNPNRARPNGSDSRPRMMTPRTTSRNPRRTRRNRKPTPAGYSPKYLGNMRLDAKWASESLAIAGELDDTEKPLRLIEQTRAIMDTIERKLRSEPPDDAEDETD